MNLLQGDNKTLKGLIEKNGNQLVEIYLAGCKHVGSRMLTVIQVRISILLFTYGFVIV